MQRARSNYKHRPDNLPYLSTSNPAISSQELILIMKQGFSQQADLLRQIICILEISGNTQHKYLSSLNRNFKNNQANPIYSKISGLNGNIKDVIHSEEDSSRKKQSKEEGAKKVIKQKSRNSPLSNKNKNESSSYQSLQKDHLIRKTSSKKIKDTNKQVNEPSLFKKISIKDKQASINTKYLPQVKNIKQLVDNELVQITEDRKNYHKTQHNSNSSLILSRVQYKDNLLEVKLPDINEIQYQKSPRNNLSSSIRQINQNKLISLSKKQFSPQGQLQSKGKRNNEAKNRHLLIQSQFKKWIAQLMSTLCKVSFFGLFSKQMSQKQTKAYFCKNYIYNYIKAREKIRSNNYTQNLQKIFLQIFQIQSKSSIKFLKLKYPQQEKAYVDQKIYNMIPVVDISIDYESYIIENLGFKQKAFKWKQIKLFINALIKETNQKQKLFKETVTQLFKDKDGNLISGLSCAVNTKIKPNSPQYSAQQIQQDGLIIKSPQIMRIVIKWIQYLQELINDICNNKKIPEWFSSPDKDYWDVWSDNDKKLFIESLKQNGKFNDQTKMHQPLKQQNNSQKSIIRNFSRRMLDILNEYKSNFDIVPKDQADIGIFTSVMASNIQSLASEQLHYLLNRLNISTTKSFEKSQIFPIFDLFRGKCSGSFKQIFRVYQNILDNKDIKIIKVKNRINTSNKDFLINLIMQDTAFVCELQLHIQDSSSKTQDEKHIYKATCSNTFNHFLYELQRSKYGPLAESVTVFESQDEVPSFFCLQQLQKITKNKLKSNIFDKDISIDDNYQLNIESEEGFKILTNQSMDIYCNYCMKIYKSYSSFLPFAMKESDGTTVCTDCLLGRLSEKQLRMLLFKKHYEFFRSIDNQKQFNQLKPNYFVQVGKFSKQFTIYKKSNKMYLSSMLQVLPQKDIKRPKISKALFENSFIYVLRDPNCLSSSKIETNSIYSLLNQNDLQLIYTPKNFGSIMLYIQNNPNDDKVFVIDVFSDKYSERQVKQLEICKFVTQAEGQAKSKVLNWKLQYSRNDINPFRYLSQKISNCIYNLTISSLLNKAPIINIRNLRILSIQLQAKWNDIEFKGMGTPKLQVLKLSLKNKQQTIDIRKIPFIQLTQIHITAKGPVECLKFQNNDDNIQLFIEDEYMNKRAKESFRSQKLYTANSFSREGWQSPAKNWKGNTPWKKQIQILTPKDFNSFPKRQRKIALDKLQTILIRLQDECGTLTFNGLTHSNLQYINIQQSHQQQSTIQLIDFSKMKLPKLQLLQCCTEFDQQIKFFSGFDIAGQRAQIPLLEIFKFESRCKEIHLQYLNIQNIKQYSCKQWGKQQQSKEIHQPHSNFQKLQKLTVQCSTFPFDKIIKPEKLQVLNLCNLKDCVQIFQKYGALLSSLKQLNLNNQQFALVKSQLRFCHQMNKLQKLHLNSFYSIDFGNTMSNLISLTVQNTNMQQIDLSKLDCKLQQLNLFDNQNLRAIVFSSPAQIFYLQRICLRNNNLVENFMKNIQFSKKSFWNLREIQINGIWMKKEEWWSSWNQMKKPVFKDGQPVFQ